MSDADDIIVLLRSYFDALYEGDIGALASIFHSKARLYIVVDNAVTETDLPRYLEIVRGRPTPRSQSARRADQIHSVAISSPSVAVAVVSLVLFDKHFTDQLTLMKEDRRWQIAAKVYHLHAEGEFEKKI